MYKIETFNKNLKYWALFFDWKYKEVETIVKMPENIWDAASYLTVGKWNMNSKPVNIKIKYIITTDICLN